MIWATYCTVTATMANRRYGGTLFLMLTTLTLSIEYFAGRAGEMNFNVRAVVYLGLAAAMSFGYAV